MDLGAIGSGGVAPPPLQPVAVAVVMARLADLAGREVSVVDLLATAGVSDPARLPPEDRAAALAVLTRLVEQGGGRLTPTPNGVRVDLPSPDPSAGGPRPGGTAAGVPAPLTTPASPGAASATAGPAVPLRPLLVLPVVAEPPSPTGAAPGATQPTVSPGTAGSAPSPPPPSTGLPAAHVEYRAVVDRLALPADLGAALREVASLESAAPVRFLAAVGPQPAASVIVVDAPIAALAEGLGPLIERLASERGVGLLQLAPPPTNQPWTAPAAELAATIREAASGAPTILARGHAAPAVLELLRQQPDIAARLVLDLRAVLDGAAAGRGVDAAAAASAPQVDTTLQALLAAATGTAGPPPPRRTRPRRGLPMDAIRKAAAAFFQALFGVPVDEELFRARAEVTVLGGGAHADLAAAIGGAFDRGRGRTIASEDELLAELT